MSFPHTRGDGPVLTCISTNPQGFSPHAWGWPETTALILSGQGVFPTRVGMARKKIQIKSQAARFPHTRGDGPQTAVMTHEEVEFSPHAWGWPAVSKRSCTLGQVFPTRVGMARDYTLLRRMPRGFPHTRGDGPVFCRENGGGKIVFPTRVGMARMD